MSKFNKQAYLDSVKVILPNISWVNSTEDFPKINLPEVVRLVSEEYFLRDVDSLSYQERLAFYVIKTFAQELREFGYYSFGETGCNDIKI